MYASNMIERIALYATLGLVLQQLDQGATQWGFWAVLGLFVVNGWLNTQEGVEQGVSRGLSIWVDLTDEQRTELIELVKTVEREHND
jgi:hypothetical protein